MRSLAVLPLPWRPHRRREAQGAPRCSAASGLRLPRHGVRGPPDDSAALGPRVRAPGLAQPPPEPGEVIIIKDSARPEMTCYDARISWNDTQALLAMGLWPDTFPPFARLK